MAKLIEWRVANRQLVMCQNCEKGNFRFDENHKLYTVTQINYDRYDI